VTDHDQEVRSIASLLISRYGERAVSVATHQALKARDCGEPRRMEAWRWIAGAVHQVLRSDPRDEQPAIPEHAEQH
jgi:hypothetical protein